MEITFDNSSRLPSDPNEVFSYKGVVSEGVLVYYEDHQNYFNRVFRQVLREKDCCCWVGGKSFVGKNELWKRVVERVV